MKARHIFPTLLLAVSCSFHSNDTNLLEKEIRTSPQAKRVPLESLDKMDPSLRSYNTRYQIDSMTTPEYLAVYADSTVLSHEGNLLVISGHDEQGIYRFAINTQGELQGSSFFMTNRIRYDIKASDDGKQLYFFSESPDGQIVSLGSRENTDFVNGRFSQHSLNDNLLPCLVSHFHYRAQDAIRTARENLE